MEKRIENWSYWLGIACLLITIVGKAGNAVGLWRALPPAPGEISYWSFYCLNLQFPTEKLIRALADAGY